MTRKNPPTKVVSTRKTRNLNTAKEYCYIETTMKPILQYRDLIDVKIKDSGDPMKIVQDVAPEIFCAYEKFDMTLYVGDRFVLRANVIDRLKEASTALERLRPGSRLRLAYGYRHPEVQRSYFEKRRQEVSAREPGLSEASLIAATHLLTASPDVAGHPTGGAIDVTIQNADGPIDMGSGIADFSSDKIETFADGLTDTQRENRTLLRTVLLDAGFASFDGEWWHFSYGDREWAVYYGKPNAIYDQIEYRLA